MFLFLKIIRLDQLMEILKRDLATDNTRMTRTAQQHMEQFISYIVANKKRSHASARLIKLVAEMMMRNRVQRLAQNKKANDVDMKHSVTKQDVEMFTPAMLDSMISESEYNRVQAMNRRILHCYSFYRV